MGRHAEGKAMYNLCLAQRSTGPQEKKGGRRKEGRRSLSSLHENRCQRRKTETTSPGKSPASSDEEKGGAQDLKATTILFMRKANCPKGRRLWIAALWATAHQEKGKGDAIGIQMSCDT